jgi:AmiR/NasT family two-component response regulator
MTPSYRVLVADRDPQALKLHRCCVESAGHEVAAEATTGDTLVELCRSEAPELIIADVTLLETGGAEPAPMAALSKGAPLIVLSESFTEATIDRASDCGAYAYIVKPVNAPCLRAAIALAMRQFEELQASRRDADQARQALQDRKTVERAKSVVMQRLAIDEPAALRHLQSLARRTRKTLVSLADSILLSEQALCGSQ